MLDDVLWPDAEFEGLSVDYSTVTLTIEESSGRRRLVSCRGYVSLLLPTFWDEIVVQSGVVEKGAQATASAVSALDERLGASRPPSGSAERNKGEFSALTVRFIDGAELTIVAAEFEAS